MRRRVRQCGFALLLVLVLVAIAGAVLAHVASRTMVGALESRGAVEELQRRWAVTSCHATFLGRAEGLLDEAERGQAGPDVDTYLNKPIPEMHLSFQLAGTDYEMVLTDEQAKLNVNWLIPTAGRAGAQATLARLVSERAGSWDRPVTVNLRILATPEASEESRALLKIGGYGQIFEGISPSCLIGGNGSRGLASDITCWGDGKVNVRRASSAAIGLACEKNLGPSVIQGLLSARDRNPYAKLSKLLAGLDKVDASQKAKIMERLTDQSNCHGVWLITRGTQRSWYNLAVGLGGSAAKADGSADGQQSIVRRYDFTW